MKQKIKLKIDNEFKSEFEKLKQLLDLVKVEYIIENVERRSMSGHTYEDHYLFIEYDKEEMFRRIDRLNGQKNKVSTN